MIRKCLSEKDKIAGAELTSEYRGVKHGHSYLLMGCAKIYIKPRQLKTVSYTVQYVSREKGVDMGCWNFMRTNMKVAVLYI